MMKFICCGCLDGYIYNMIMIWLLMSGDGWMLYLSVLSLIG